MIINVEDQTKFFNFVFSKIYLTNNIIDINNIFCKTCAKHALMHSKDKNLLKCSFKNNRSRDFDKRREKSVNYLTKLKNSEILNINHEKRKERKVHKFRNFNFIKTFVAVFIALLINGKYI